MNVRAARPPWLQYFHHSSCFVVFFFVVVLFFLGSFILPKIATDDENLVGESGECELQRFKPAAVVWKGPPANQPADSRVFRPSVHVSAQP